MHVDLKAHGSLKTGREMKEKLKVMAASSASATQWDKRGNKKGKE